MKKDHKQYFIGKTMEGSDVLSDYIYLSHEQKLSVLHDLVVDLQEDHERSRDFIATMADYMVKMLKRIEAIEKHLGAKYESN